MKLLLTTIIAIMILGDVTFAQEQKNNSSNNILTQASISVTIGGSFIINGTFPALPYERVDQFITRMYNQAKQNMLSIAKDLKTSTTILKNINEEYAIRGIILKRASGEEKIIDLAKFRLNGNFDNNPYLKNDDVLIFPVVNIKQNFFYIEGAVNSPGTFMFVDGDKLSDAIELAQGLNKAYENIESAEISRLSLDGTKMNSFVVNISENVPLQRGDRIRVLGIPSQRSDYYVKVLGEVNLPGNIPISKSSTTVAEVIKKAGGFTKLADVSRAELIRGANAFESILFSEQLEQLQMLRMSTLIEEDSLYFNIDEKLRFIRGNGLVDFTKIFDENSVDNKFLVQQYDVIYVPTKIDLVYVYGQVNNAGYIKFSEGKDYSYYIEKAGGLGETASNIYIIKNKSRSWKSAEEDNINIEPGDYIWVSKKTPRTFWYNLEQASRIATVVSAIATIIVLLTRI